MGAVVVDITVDKSATYGETLRFWADLAKTTRRNLTGCVLKFELRETPTSATVLSLASNVVSASGNINITNAAQGEAGFRLEAAFCATLKNLDHVYKMTLTLADGTTIERFRQGKLRPTLW